MITVSNNCCAERHVDACAAPRVEVSLEVLNALYGSQAAKALMFFMERADDVTRSRFLTQFVDVEQQAQLSTANIVVRRTGKDVRQMGNVGKFQIFVQMSGGDTRLLHFTNQVSTVYYLLNLIDRCHKQGVLSPLNLGSNKQVFVQLYHQAYDNITREEVLRRYELMLFRRVGNSLRAGRLNEVIYDIRRHLDKLFGSYGQNYQPYAMTAHSHLAIPANHILFEGEAEALLDFSCA